MLSDREMKSESGFSLAMASQPLLQCFLVALKCGKAGGRMKLKSAFVLLLQDQGQDPSDSVVIQGCSQSDCTWGEEKHLVNNSQYIHKKEYDEKTHEATKSL